MPIDIISSSVTSIAGRQGVLSTVSLAELLLGIESLPAGKRRKALAAALADQVIALFGERVVPFDLAAAQTYAKIVARARRHGHPIAVADAQIAAIAVSRRFSVATRDEAPFQAAGVPVVNPWTATLEARMAGPD